MHDEIFIFRFARQNRPGMREGKRAVSEHSMINTVPVGKKDTWCHSAKSLAVSAAAAAAEASKRHARRKNMCLFALLERISSG